MNYTGFYMLHVYTQNREPEACFPLYQLNGSPWHFAHEWAIEHNTPCRIAANNIWLTGLHTPKPKKK